MVIYKIKNIKNGHEYIGSTNDFRKRTYSHIRALRSGSHHSFRLQKAFSKHGETSFIFEVIEEVETRDNLVSREQHYIDTLCPRYNVCRNAANTSGVRHSMASRLKLSITLKKKYASGEMVSAKGMSGKRQSESAKKLISTANKGKIISIETRHKISKASASRKKPVLWVEAGIEYESKRAAQKILKIEKSQLSRNIKQGKQTRGMTLVYVDKGKVS